MSVSIIVPNFNHYKFLPRRLDTIFNQSFQEFEVIILDDCSTDGSWEYLLGFANHPKVSHCIRNKMNSGSPFSQWKKGIELSKYSLIWIAESDDFCDKSFLENMVSKLSPESALIYCASIFVDENGSQVNNRFPNWYPDDLENLIRWKSNYSCDGRIEILNFLAFKNTIVNASSVVFRKPELIPPEILSMRFCGDWYFWIFLLKDKKLDYFAGRLNYFTTRPFLPEKSLDNLEYIRFMEIMKCIRFSRNVLGIRFPRKIDLVRYSDLAKFYAWNFHKINLPFKSFRSMPYFLIPIFIYQYFKHEMAKWIHS